MMKRILILAVVRLLSAALPVGAASVTPSSATNYIFTSPLFPASIRGEVMGYPPAYYDPRGEDVDWMFEAFKERFALIDGEMPSLETYLKPSFGRWDISATNRLIRWSTAVDASGVTNVVVGYNLATNAPRFTLANQNVKTLYDNIPSIFFARALGYDTGATPGYRSYYLDGSAELATSARPTYPYGHSPSFTNITSSVGYTNAISSNSTTIEMPMTNGTTSVFTNMWFATLSLPVTNSVTNVVEACPLDYCHAGNGPFPGFPDALKFSIAKSWPTRYGFVAQAYSALRSADRLAEEASITNAAPGMELFTHWVYTEPGYTTNETTTTISTNEHFSSEYSILGSQEKKYAWNSETQQYEAFYDIYVSEKQTPEYQAVAPTRFSSEIITTGHTERVELEAAFAVVELFYSSSHQEGGRTNLHWVADDSLDEIVVVPIAGNNHLDLSEPVARATVTLNSRSLCEEAAGAAGVPQPPEAGGFTPVQGTDSSWEIDCKKVVLIYRTKPSSKFNSW